jgi:hypothetical protein
MAQNTIYPQGTVEVTVPAAQSIAISNFGGGIAKIYYLIEDANRPDAWQFQQSLNDSSVTLGAFSVATTVKIEAGNSKVFYDVAVSPDTGVGDADTLGGNPPSYYATDSEAVHIAGSETISGAKTFSSNLTMSGSVANIKLGNNWLSGDGDDEGVFVKSDGYVGINTNNPGARLTVQEATGNVIIRLGLNDASDWYINNNSGVFQISRPGSAKMSFLDAGYVGINTETPGVELEVNGDVEATTLTTTSTLTAGNGASGTFTTADAKTVTVTDGIITAIV